MIVSFHEVVHGKYLGMEVVAVTFRCTDACCFDFVWIGPISCCNSVQLTFTTNDCFLICICYVATFIYKLTLYAGLQCILSRCLPGTAMRSRWCTSGWATLRTTTPLRRSGTSVSGSNAPRPSSRPAFSSIWPAPRRYEGEGEHRG